MATKKQETIEFEMTAVIPVAQYANVQPVIKGYGATYDEARDDASKKMEDLWAMYAEDSIQDKLKIASTTSVVHDTLFKCFATGVEVPFDTVTHTYGDGDWLSGSAYAKQFEHEFDKKMIIPRSAKKLGVSEEEVDDYWTGKAESSTTLGTAVHRALEHYGKYAQLAESDIDSKTGEMKGYGIHALLLPIVEKYFEAFGDRDGERSVYEPFIANADKKWCGQIDRLVVTGDKKCIIRDYKTNASLDKIGQPANLKAPFSYMTNTPLSKYTLQLSFYAAIMEAAGWEVEGLFIDWLNPEMMEWEAISVKQVDIEKPQVLDLSKVTI